MAQLHDDPSAYHGVRSIHALGEERERDSSGGVFDGSALIHAETPKVALRRKVETEIDQMGVALLPCAGRLRADRLALYGVIAAVVTERVRQELTTPEHAPDPREDDPYGDRRWLADRRPASRRA